MRFFTATALCAFLFYSSKAYALNGFMSLGYGSGGSDLSTVTGGQNYEIKAGEGYIISGGVIWPISPTTPHRFEAQFGIGYVFQNDSDEKDKNTVSWRRIPIDLIYYYQNTRELFRLGYGVSYQIENRLDAKGANGTASSDVDNELGWVFAVEKLLPSGDNDRLGVGLRYNMIDYSSSGFSRDANGDALFLTFFLLGLN